MNSNKFINQQHFFEINLGVPQGSGYPLQSFFCRPDKNRDNTKKGFPLLSLTQYTEQLTQNILYEIYQTFIRNFFHNIFKQHYYGTRI